MRDRRAVRVAMVQAVCNGGELVGRVAGELFPRLVRPKGIRVVEDVPQDAALVGIEQVVEAELIGRRDEIGPGRDDFEALRIAGDMERRVFERRGIARQLLESGIEAALLLLVFEAKKPIFQTSAKPLPPPVLVRPRSNVNSSPSLSTAAGLG
jgi:hypothetical protein